MQPSSNVAVCMLGSIRTFSEDCVARLTLQRVAAPLYADVYAFVNVPIEYSYQRKMRTLEHVQNTIESTPNVTLSMAHVDYNPNTRLSGRAQIHGFKKCWNFTRLKRYTWIIRTRTDTYHGFTIRSLPAMVYHPVAFVTYIGLRHCVGDQFAVLGGRTAHKTYLFDGANALSNVRFDKQAPECAIGAMLYDNGVDVHDFRLLVAKTPEGHEPVVQVVRSQCDTATKGMNWIRPAFQEPINITAGDMTRAIKNRWPPKPTTWQSLPVTLKIINRLWNSRI